jgi:hypothetical protein
MRITALFCSAMVSMVKITMSYAAGCGDITVCVKNPPDPPAPPSCVTYPNFCSAMPAQVADSFAPAQATNSAWPNYSVRLDNMSQDQIGKSLDMIQLDKSKLPLPQ